MEPTLNSVAVFAYARMNPPTEGHRNLFNQVSETALETGGKPFIVLSRTTGDAKNPLTPVQKIKHVTRIVGDGPTVLATADLPSPVHWLSFLYEKMGYKELIIVCGQDRVDEYQTIVHRCHGKDFSFWNYRYVVGPRSHISGTAARKAAYDHDWDAFLSLYPTTEHSHVRDLYQDLVASQPINRPKSRVYNSGSSNEEKPTG